MPHMLGTRAKVTKAPWYCCPGHTPHNPPRHALRKAKRREERTWRRALRRNAANDI